jgi:hypothetical protein
MTRHMITVDGNEAVASVAHRTNEVIVIYPITPGEAVAGRRGGETRRRGLSEFLCQRGWERFLHRPSDSLLLVLGVAVYCGPADNACNPAEAR